MFIFQSNNGKFIFKLKITLTLRQGPRQKKSVFNKDKLRAMLCIDFYILSI